MTFVIYLIPNTFLQLCSMLLTLPMIAKLLLYKMSFTLHLSFDTPWYELIYTVCVLCYDFVVCLLRCIWAILHLYFINLALYVQNITPLSFIFYSEFFQFYFFFLVCLLCFLCYITPTLEYDLHCIFAILQLFMIFFTLLQELITPIFYVLYPDLTKQYACILCFLLCS